MSAATSVFLALSLALSDVPASGVQEAVDLRDYGPCGPVSLYLVTQLRQMPTNWAQVKELLGPADSDRSHSFADLSRAGTALGMFPVGLNFPREALAGLPMPAIIQVHDPNHDHGRPHLLVRYGPKRKACTCSTPRT
jgi:hypothetical protein